MGAMSEWSFDGFSFFLGMLAGASGVVAAVAIYVTGHMDGAKAAKKPGGK
jgi:hypothetical protein